MENKLYQYEKQHISAIRETLGECMVLLRADGSFPIESPCKIAAYGSGVRHTIKGGTGSGEVNSRFFISIEKGLKKAGFTIVNEDWLDSYDNVLSEAKKQFVKRLKAEAKKEHVLLPVYAMGKVMPSPEYDMPLTSEPDMDTDTDTDTDTAIYVVSRISGEGNDREVVPGDILLNESEIRDILEANRRYKRFMLVLNTGGVVDLSPVSDVKNILVLSQLGISTGSALADVILGKCNPSGHLTTTWAAWEDYYQTDDFDDLNETRYTEGIYVGYRYFDTFGKRALFPFGHGLSYTQFEIHNVRVELNGSYVNLHAAIQNTGKHSGKEVLQAYLSAPSDKLDKPYQELCGFAKTDELEPGEEEAVRIGFDLSDFASYDEKRASYILDAGDYVIRVGSSSVDTAEVAIIELNEEVCVLQTKNVLGTIPFEDLKTTINEAEANKTPRDESAVRRLILKSSDVTTRQIDVHEDYEILPEVENMPVEQAALLCIGDFSNRHGIAGIIGESSSSVCGAAGETCSLSNTVPNMVMADGPAGLRLTRRYYTDEKGNHAIGESALPESIMDTLPGALKAIVKIMDSSGTPKKGVEVKEQYCTAIPIGTAIAQSFNTDLAQLYGDIVGCEMERFGVALWLAPALNIHRSIRCGRNFEYYSEDPLVSGMMAAGVTLGVQRHKGCSTTIKHYAANNKEKNRYCNNSMVSERAMREIYLRGFRICISKSMPNAVMTSYNLLNGTHTAENRGLIEDILRVEYGFKGIVMTDWVVAMAEDKRSKYRNSLAAQTVMAGGDLFMPGGKKDYNNLLSGLEKGIVTEKQIRINASRVLRMARSSINA